MRMRVEQEARPCGQPTSERPRETDLRNRPLADPEILPLDISSQARQKDRHLRRQSAPLDVDVMPHLVDENRSGETSAETPTVDRCIDREKGEKAQKEFE